jgi:hypothetical protein
MCCLTSAVADALSLRRRLDLFNAVSQLRQLNPAGGVCFRSRLDTWADTVFSLITSVLAISA